MLLAGKGSTLCVKCNKPSSMPMRDDAELATSTAVMPVNRRTGVVEMVDDVVSCRLKLSTLAEHFE